MKTENKNRQLTAENVRLRHPELEDLAYIRKLWADPDTMKEVGGPIVMDEERARRWFEKMVDPGSPGDRYFLIFNRENLPVGEASFHRFDPGTKTAEFNLKVEARHRYKSYGPEAARLILEYFFSGFGGEVMVDPIALENTAGQKALLSIGFEHDPSRTDVFMVRMTKQKFYLTDPENEN
ncbi:MAG: GNAT family N-acetyltransferase [Deltaproteobacteria bacterium]|nr:GNAT family N-acetyltransferase [Deltaproteobacteria bacterium]